MGKYMEDLNSYKLLFEYIWGILFDRQRIAKMPLIKREMTK